MSETSTHHLVACSCCGITQRAPAVSAGMRLACVRCGHVLNGAPSRFSNQRTMAIALAALILYPIAVALPMLRIRQFGHETETSILNGVATLLASGQLAVGLVVLLCSIVFPLGKLLSMVILSAGGLGVMTAKHKAFTYKLVEWTGRWGMLDVLLVAVLVAALKLGNVMDVSPGPAAMAFTLCVVLSLLATASFNPRGVWESRA